VLVMIEFAFNVAWVASSPQTLTTVFGSPYPLTYQECNGDNFNMWQGVSYAYKAAFLLYGVFLAVMTRGLPEAFNESAWIGVAIYNTALCGGVVLLAVYAGRTQDTQTGVFVLTCILIIWVSLATALLIVLPKLYRIYYDDERIANRNGDGAKDTPPPRSDLESNLMLHVVGGANPDVEVSAAVQKPAHASNPVTTAPTSVIASKSNSGTNNTPPTTTH